MWSPQAQFAGYYVALEKGFYRKCGLDVDIIQGGPDHIPAEMLKSGKVDFCLLWLSSAIQRRSEGLSLVNIAQIVRRSALMLVARKSSEILKPEDMNGRKVSLWEGDLRLQPRAFFSKYKINPEIITQSYTVNLFLAGGTDVASAMWYNEYHTIINSGLDEEELTTFFFDAHGLNFPEDGIYALEETLQKNPHAAAAFVGASVAGWQYAFLHPDEALDIVLKYMKQAKVPANRVHQRWMLARMKDLILSPDGQAAVGTLDRAEYETVASELQTQGLIKTIPPFSEFYQAVNAHAQE
ncbi:MAG TPA: ABC transporter substrate-binding protein [Syntrophobacteraceae bacterium]|nr:ABC transporter substrate-binding protein [Syntrophobacteraceae bacterium]